MFKAGSGWDWALCRGASALKVLLVAEIVEGVSLGESETPGWLIFLAELLYSLASSTPLLLVVVSASLMWEGVLFSAWMRVDRCKLLRLRVFF